MKNSLLTVFLSSLSVLCFSQTYTFDYFSHTNYVNNNPGQVVLLNDNWEQDIEYLGSGHSYHIRYIYDVTNQTVETIEFDNNGNSIEEYHTIDPIEVNYADNEFMLVFNPLNDKFSLFYFNNEKTPYFVVEGLNGEGFFCTQDDFTYIIN